jgi:hypothetical protein
MGVACGIATSMAYACQEVKTGGLPASYRFIHGAEFVLQHRQVPLVP